MSKDKEPKTLQQAILHFANYENCHRFMMDLRWPDGKVLCPRCGSENVSWLPNAKVFKCFEKHDRVKFSLKVGTIFEDSPIALEKWLPVMWMISNCKNGVSSYEIHRAIGVTQKTAWFMLQRARLAMQGDAIENFGGQGETIEVDETYIGGLARNMHKSKRLKKFKDGALTGGSGKTAVFGLMQRNPGKGKSKVHAQVVPDQWKETVNGILQSTVEKGATIYSDEHGAYAHLNEAGFIHDFVRHAQHYVRGNVHTNGIENFWSCFKRGIKGTYISIEPFHTFRYLDEQVFRFNQREGNDSDRFELVMKQITNKRLTYKELTGKAKEAETEATN